LVDQGSIPGKIREFFFSSPLTLGPIHSTLQQVIGTISVGKRQPNHEAADSHPSNVDV